MPTYEYLCPNGHRFDRFQKISDPPGADCPDCGEAAERQISAGAGFLFKGDGFYITDYRGKDYREKAKSESPDSASAPGKEKGGAPASGSAPASGNTPSGGSTAPGGDASGGASPKKDG